MYEGDQDPSVMGGSGFLFRAPMEASMHSMYSPPL